MVRSIYIMAYFECMKKWYAEQGIEFSNWNDKDLTRCDDGKAPGRDLRYVPRNSAEHLVDEFTRYALSRQALTPGEQFIYLGWNVNPTNALEATRSHLMERRVPVGDTPAVIKPKGIPDGSKQIKWFRMCDWELSVFMLTNRGNTAEDLEELYEARIQMKSEIPVDMGPVFIMDWPSFMINTVHRTMQTSNPITNAGNLFALKYDVTLKGPSIEFDEKQMGPARSISVALYEMGNYAEERKHLDTITVENQ